MEAIVKTVRPTMLVTPKPEAVKADDFRVYARDRFGALIGKEPARLNSCIGFTPKKVEEIAAESGLSVERAQEHLGYWKDHKETGIGKVLQETPEGWAVTA